MATASTPAPPRGTIAAPARRRGDREAAHDGDAGLAGSLDLPARRQRHRRLSRCVHGPRARRTAGGHGDGGRGAGRLRARGPFALRPPMGRGDDRPQHRRHGHRLLRDGADYDKRGSPRVPDRRHGRGRAHPALRGRGGAGLPQPALVHLGDAGRFARQRRPLVRLPRRLRTRAPRARREPPAQPAASARPGASRRRRLWRGTSRSQTRAPEATARRWPI